MNETTRLTLAIQHIESVTNLMKDNPYEKFLYGHLISIKVELERQLTLQQVFDDSKDPD